MPTFTVKEIVNARPWSKDGGDPTVIYYDFQVEEIPDRINVGRKPSNPLTVGMKLEGTLEDDQRGNGKKLRTSFGGGGGGGPRGKTPEERKSIQMQASHKVAVEILRVAAEHGDYKPPSAGDVVSQVKLIAAALYQQIEEASA